MGGGKDLGVIYQEKADLMTLTFSKKLKLINPIDSFLPSLDLLNPVYRV